MGSSGLMGNYEKKPQYSTKLNLVALMDIFTILVFFLLLNSGDSKQLEKAKFIKLPDSSAGKPPYGELMIIISDKDIVLDTEVVATVESVVKEPEKGLATLGDALVKYINDRGTLMTQFEKDSGFSVTIMGDETVPYSLLKEVMKTCQDKNFRNISLAVNRVVAPVFEVGGDAIDLTTAQTLGGG